MLSQMNVKSEGSAYPGASYALAIRLGQKSSPNFRNGWHNFCQVYGELHAHNEKPVFDPASYSDEFIQSFFDCLGLCYAQSVEREGVAPRGMALNAAKHAKVLGGPDVAKAKVIVQASFSRYNINSEKSSENFSKRPEANLAVQGLGTNHSTKDHPAANNIKPPVNQVDWLGAMQPPRSSMDNKRLSLPPQMDQRSRHQQAPTRVVGRTPPAALQTTSAPDNKPGLWSHFNTKPNLLRSRKESSNKLDYLAKDHLLPGPPSHQNPGPPRGGIRTSRKGDSNILDYWVKDDHLPVGNYPSSSSRKSRKELAYFAQLDQQLPVHPAPSSSSNALELVKLIHRSAAETDVVELVKQGQKHSSSWKKLWAEHCKTYGHGVNDPVKHKGIFHVAFVLRFGLTGLADKPWAAPFLVSLGDVSKSYLVKTISAGIMEKQLPGENKQLPASENKFATRWEEFAKTRVNPSGITTSDPSMHNASALLEFLDACVLREFRDMPLLQPYISGLGFEHAISNSNACDRTRESVVQPDNMRFLGLELFEDAISNADNISVLGSEDAATSNTPHAPWEKA